ncbi:MULTISPECIES: TonB-dependent receptor [Parabacteroides]|uniref:TonB-dependent receptor n=1 Tax=Parabacteroides TaxID=375288 RepID=UPI00240D3920|nr:TonB-dependent receptor [Parabacteroides chongii]WFE86215.1 TonB-dependent receptor [Parabacteroides chongii]
MKLAFVYLFILVSGVFATEADSQTMKVSIVAKNISTQDLMQEIEKQTDYLFVYNKNEINLHHKVTVNAADKTVAEVLNQAFDQTDITYAVEGSNIMLMKKGEENRSSAIAQQKTRTINGVVTDTNGETIIGANVSVKGTTIGTITDIDGKFSLEVPENAQLQISYIGYLTHEVTVGNKISFDIQLAEDTQNLEEVVVVGYGIQKKTSISGSIATIAQEDIKKASTSNLSESLVGRMPGLIAVNESGKPGSGSKLLIRGQGTWNNSDPLVIVDGIERDFSNLDPNEIENISVLKDAAAAAVYGARAANGVILVTTKRGKDGKPSVKLDTYYGLKSVTRYPDLANPYEWATTRNKAYLMDGVDPNDTRIFSKEQLDKFRNGEQGTDWYKETFNKTASQYYANLNLSGGSERVKYFVSLGHHNEDGLIDNFDYKKYNFRSNIDAKVTERLNISADVDASTRTYDTPGWNPEDLYHYVARQNPTLPAYHPNGLPANTNGEHLPEMVHSSGNNKQTYNDFRVTFKADYKIPGIEGLVAKGMFSYGKNYMYNKKFFIPYKMYDINENGDITNTKVVGEKTKLDEKFDQGDGYTYNLSLNYNRTFGKHDVGLLFLYEEESSKGNEFSAFRTNFVSNSVPQLSAGGDTDKTNAGKAHEWARNGLVGRINYAYNGTYMFEASFRYDGSITFPKGHRYGFFPSVSGAWRISNESFIKDNFSFIDNLKLRASYGTLGNDQVKLWQYMSEFVYSDVATIGGNNVNSIAVYKDLFPNPDITWEKSSTFDLGLEGLLWQGLLGFEVDFFAKRTKDILAPQIRTIPETFGATLPDINYGILDNKGLEISLTHANQIGDFTYRIGGNFSFVRNKVIQFDESETTPDYYKVVGRPFTHTLSTSGTKVNLMDNTTEKIGRPYAGLVGMKAIGIFQSQEEIDAWPKQFNGGQKPGDIKYADVNGDGMINENDLIVVDRYGSIPEIIYGFNFSLGWKGFELTALFQGAAHKSVMLEGYGTTMFLDGSSNYYSYLSDNSWSPENRDAQYPRAYVGGNSNNNRASNIWMKNGNYLRLKNIELSYTFPKSLLAKAKVINGLRLYINGTNLLTFDKLDIMDPEMTGGSAQYYPQMKSVNFGLNFTY